MPINPVILAADPIKSRAYFRHFRWGGRRTCPHCSHRGLWRPASGRFKCKSCHYRFDDFTGTYLGRLRIPMDGLAHALYLFALGVPACRAQWYLPIKSRSTVERSFLVFRLAIHDASISDMEQASRELGMDPIPSDSHRSLKQSWGNREKCVVFGISRKECKDEGRRGWQVLTFPVPKLPNCLLKDLIKGPLKTGGVHYVDDSHGYVVLKMGARNERIAIKGGKNDRGRRRLDWIDGFLGFARIWLEHYRGVFQEYFPLYLKEIELRFNHNHDPKELFPLVARMIVRRDM